MISNIMTLEEAARYLKLASVTLYRKARSREIPAAKLGRSWRFHRDQLEEWLKQQAVGPAEKLEEVVAFRHLSTRETKEVKQYIESLKIKFPEITRVILYGSRARGDFGAYSDIDLLLVVRGKLTELWKRELATQTNQFNLDHDVMIQAISLSDAEWTTPSFRNYLLVEAIRREGILIYG